MATSSLSEMRMALSRPSYRPTVSTRRGSPASNRMCVAATASAKKVLVPIGEGYEPPHCMIGARNIRSTTIHLVLLRRQCGYRRGSMS